MLVRTINQSGRPYTPHMKIKLTVSQPSRTGHTPGLCQLVTQENSQKTPRNHQTQTLTLTFHTCVGTYWSKMLLTLIGHTDKLIIFCKLVESKPLNPMKQHSPSGDCPRLTEFKSVGLRSVFLYTMHLKPCHLLSGTIAEASPE